MPNLSKRFAVFLCVTLFTFLAAACSKDREGATSIPYKQAEAKSVAPTVKVDSSDIATEISLNGFRLQQFVNIAPGVLGAPLQSRETEHLGMTAYPVDANSFMVVTHHKSHPHNISKLQLTGSATSALAFKGLTLGDPKDKVLSVLGPPDEIEKINEPKVSLYRYRARNYTVELDESDRLYSIQIFMTTELNEKRDVTKDDWKDFKAAVISKDVQKVLEMMRPDVEIFKSGKTLSIRTRYSDFVQNPDKEFISALLADSDSVLRELMQSEPEEEIRLVMDFGVGKVFKFKKGKILDEIAFFPYNGRYRVYEIAFRERGK